MNERLFEFCVPELGPVIECPDAGTKRIPVRFGAPRARGRPDFVMAFPAGHPEQGVFVASVARQGQDDVWLKGWIPYAFAAGEVAQVAIVLVYLTGRGLARCPQLHGDCPSAEDFCACTVPPPTEALVRELQDAQPHWCMPAGDFSHMQSHFSHVVDIGYRLKKTEPGAERELHFALGSCQYPAMLLDDAVAYAAYERLSERLDQTDAPAFVLLLGDQIYVDVTAGLFDPKKEYDVHGRQYRQWLAAAAVRKVLRRRHSYMMLDDHEIANDWQGLEGASPAYSRNEEQKAVGVRQYLKYQRGPLHYRHLAPGQCAPLWFSFQENGFPFFVCDTRAERYPRTAASLNQPGTHLMDRAQRQALENWLLQESTALKFITSASALLPRKRVISSRNPSILDGRDLSLLGQDSWCGYPASLQWLLTFVVDNDIRNLVFLSGDEHLAFAARVTVWKEHRDPVILHSLHGSPLYAPYPFANSCPEDLRGDETFHWQSGGAHYHCKVQTDYAPGEGFVLIHARQPQGRWVLDCEFERMPLHRKTMQLTF